MRNRIRNILILMSTCILGIFAFQAYWLYNSYRLRLEEFNKDINDALRVAVYNKQFIDAGRFIGRRMPGQGGHAGFSMRGKPAVFIKDTAIRNIMPAGASTVIMETHSIDDTVVPRNFQRVVHATNRTLNIQFSNRDTAYRLYADSLSRQISDMLILNKFYNERFSFKKIDSVYRQELLSRGISVDYKLDTFRIKEDTFRKDTILLLTEPIDLLQTAKVSFNPFSDILVQASFDNPVQRILGQMMGPLLSTVLLLLLTVLCFLYMLRTILKQKKLSEVKNDFINNMTHELKTPIATVSAAVEAMQNFNALNDQQKTQTYLSISRQELQRLSDLVEKVLHIATEEKDDFELYREDTDLNELISHIITNHRLKANKKVDFTYTILSDAMVKVDKTHLSNALNNLVDNAIKYSGEPAEITIQVSRQQDKLKIVVKDNGIGIPHAYQDNIFEKFFRVPTGNLHNVKGFGLGLSYVKKIVEKHGGFIRVKSEPDKGSEFQLEIPEI
ncbi:GHKL domain-containing protein [Chitinophaga sp. SYP-B3965]|uniref:sensor histidine kinase n=1 Tax=Chitinophaga sp. SYP-B3965 TaxID=2663120 RepID=UPI001299D59A|nr:HAMP domain-containing sensor histidine kinase [Chitinophaga sp. SYP-B3965]MRG46554.1 GHKL domain-containing protein [Chitinophaga sp. SYP-B3965]